MLDAAVKDPRTQHLEAVKRQHARDVLHRAEWWNCPGPSLASTRTPAVDGPYVDRVTGPHRRHHLHEPVLQWVVREAVKHAD
jgi:hypothetical protein